MNRCKRKNRRERGIDEAVKQFPMGSTNIASYDKMNIIKKAIGWNEQHATEGDYKKFQYLHEAQKGKSKEFLQKLIDWGFSETVFYFSSGIYVLLQGWKGKFEKILYLILILWTGFIALARIAVTIVPLDLLQDYLILGTVFYNLCFFVDVL